MIINVEFGISQYTAEELVNYDVYCQGYCLSELVDKIASYTSVETLNTHEQEKAEAYQEGIDVGRYRAISEAISLIEEMR